MEPKVKVNLARTHAHTRRYKWSPPQAFCFPPLLPTRDRSSRDPALRALGDTRAGSRPVMTLGLNLGTVQG